MGQAFSEKGSLLDCQLRPWKPISPGEQELDRKHMGDWYVDIILSWSFADQPVLHCKLHLRLYGMS